MKLGKLFLYYASWHYTLAFLNIWRIFGNILWFLFNFFSISLLLKTLFSPLERLHEEYPKSINLQAVASTFAVNTIMRLVGAVIRLFVVALGIIVISFSILSVFVLTLLWVIIPAFPAILFFGGIALLFS